MGLALSSYQNLPPLTGERSDERKVPARVSTQTWNRSRVVDVFQDRRHASCEDALAVRGLGYRRACNYLLVYGLVGDSGVQSCRASKHFRTRDPLRISHKSAQSTVGPLKCGVPHAAFLEHRGRNSCLTRASGSSRASQRLRSLKWSSIPVRRVHA